MQPSYASVVGAGGGAMSGSTEPPRPIGPPPSAPITHGGFIPTVTYVGVVTMFNLDNKYGFIRAITPLGYSNHAASPFVAFAHKNNINAATRTTMMQYGRPAKLITGETVIFEVGPPQQPNQRPQALHIRGIFGLPLMCEHGNIEMSDYTHRLAAWDTPGPSSSSTPPSPPGPTGPSGKTRFTPTRESWDYSSGDEEE